MLHLKIFKNDLTKINFVLEFTEKLYFNRYLTISNSNSIYELLSTSNHIGDSLQNGHYLANVKILNTWFEINDNNYKMINTPSTNSYILFYLKDKLT